jgi:DNA polymerase-3 subunit gamma/tau
MSDQSSPSAGEQSSRDGSPGDGYMVIARRYRPQVFDELVGQEHVARALQQAIASDRVGHAYLFTGARGVGKTSAARILAKALNCTSGPTSTPCNTCDICRSISTGDDVDVLEIDGASNRGIDEIRQLRQNVAIRPSRSRFKIYIIDEVHMLTKEAFNALLKTLEEPPEHVKFIFATTEPHKIPITILSRCQRFDFAGIDARAIGRRLAQIAAAEGVEIEPEAVQILAARAAGSMRDSQSLLEQLLAVAERKIAAADVNQLLGVAPVERLSSLVRQLVDHNAAAALAELDAAIDQGVEVGQLLDQLIGYFRDVMAAAAGCPAEQMLYALPSQVDEVAEVGRQLGLHTILAIVQILDQTAARMRVSLHGRTLVEMAVVRICELDDLDDLATLVAELRGSDVAQPAGDSARSGGAARRTAESRPAAAKPRSASAGGLSEAVQGSESRSGIGVGDTSHRSPVPSTAGGVAPVVGAEAAQQADPPHECRARTGPPGTPMALTDELAGELWQQAIIELGGTVASSAAHAERVAAGGSDVLVATFPASYSFCRDICEHAENRPRLERALSSAYGAPVRLRCDICGDPQTSCAPERPARASRREQLAKISEHPLVRRAMELFDVPPGQFRYVAPDDQQ